MNQSMQGLALLLSLVPFGLTRQLAPEFMAWSKDTKVFSEYTIANANLVPEQIQHQLDSFMLLDTPCEINMSRDCISRYPTSVENFLDVFFTVDRRSAWINFPSGRVLYEFLRVLNGLERSRQRWETFDTLSRRIIVEHSPAGLENMSNAEANNWANVVLQAICPDVANPVVDEASLEWIFLMKLANDSSIRDPLTFTGNKIIFWANTKSDALSKELGMKYDRHTKTYTGKNVLGKLWMRIRDNKTPLFMEQWMANFGANERSIHTNDLQTQNYAISSINAGCAPLDVDYSLLPIRFATSDPLVPADIRRILTRRDGSVFECSFPSPGSLFQCIRFSRYQQSLGLDDMDVSRLVRHVLPDGRQSYAETRDWITEVMRTNHSFNPSITDLEWILKMYLAQHPRVQAALDATGNKCILALGCDYLGMIRVETANGNVYKGMNVAGKVWTKIRDDAIRQAQVTAETTPRGSANVAPNSTIVARYPAVTPDQPLRSQPNSVSLPVQDSLPRPGPSLYDRWTRQDSVPRPGPSILDIYNGLSPSPILEIYNRAHNPAPESRPESSLMAAYNRANSRPPTAIPQANNSAVRSINTPAQTFTRQQPARNAVTPPSLVPETQAVCARLAAIRNEEAQIQARIDRLNAELALENARLSELRLEASQLTSQSGHL